MMLRVILPLVIVAAAGAFFVLQHITHLDVPRYTIGSPDTAHADTETEVPTVLFVGDIMLGRGVETLMEEIDPSYPFAQTTAFIRSFDRAVGNFEAVVPEKHMKTPDFEMRFSVRQEYLGQLYQAGFDALSLANNHSFDHGESGYAHTVTSCKHYSLVCFGHSQKLDAYSLHYEDLDETRLGILALNTVSDQFDSISLGVLLERMNFYSDIQVVYVHWGEEYEERHTDAQEVLAKSLIDNGVDAVIGHHPHVVQDIAMYKGKPIFYSLGNFIFDQYFDTDVQTGLGVSMAISSEQIEYRLHGFSSLEKRSQPEKMTPAKERDFLQDLSVDGDPEDLRAVRSGQFRAPR